MASWHKSPLARSEDFQYIAAFVAGIFVFFLGTIAANLLVTWLFNLYQTPDIALVKGTALATGTFVYALGMAVLIRSMRLFGWKSSTWSMGLGAILAGGLILIEMLLVYIYNTDCSTNANLSVVVQGALVASFGIIYGISLAMARYFDVPAKRGK